MPVKVTTISVHPDRATTLRKIRDEEGLPNMDAALDVVIENYRKK